jgi:AraC-like DNA-binding protein
MNRIEAKRDAQRMKSNLEELPERIGQFLPEDGVLEAFPGFFLARSSKPTESVTTVHQPALCFVAQGRKRALLGEEVFLYDPFHYLIFTVDLESGIQLKKGDASAKAMNASAVDTEMLDAVVRLVRLVDTPGESKALAPLIIREIIYRLLAGGQGARLGHLAAAGKDTTRISKAIGHLRKNFDQPLKIEYIAHELGMSVSGFHHHFKSVTAMSPLQFQKHLRLQEARRLMLGEDLDAATAGFRVGYEDPSYFSRDYKKQFGAPPQRDIIRLRNNLET